MGEESTDTVTIPGDYFRSILKASERFERVKSLFNYLERSDGFFVCGEAGGKDGMGLPDRILVCPSQGLDGFAVYEKKTDYSAPGW